MTNDTSYRTKGRAVFLAAIMVLSMVAGAAVLTGSAAASHDGSDYDTTIDASDGDRVWEGQTIRFDLGNSSSTYDVTGPDGTDLGSFTTNNTGIHMLDTSELGPTGDYEIRDGGLAANFTLTQQTMSASFDESINTGQNTSVTVNTNRPNAHTVVVSSSDDVDVATVFGSANKSVTGGLGTTTDLTANTSQLDAGTYNFTFGAHDSDASANATLTVEEGLDANAEFGSQSYTSVVGDTLTFNVTTSGSPDNVWINVTDDEGYYDGTLNLSNIDDDGTVAVTWNTHNAGNNSTLGFSADGANVAVDNAEGSAVDLSGDQILPRSASFEFEAFVEDPADDGEFTDIAAAQLNERSTGESTVWTAPSSVDNDAGLEDVVSAATEDDSIATQDLTIIQVEATGVYGYMADDISNFDSDGLNMTISEQDAGPYDDGESWDVQNLSDASLYKDAEAGEFFIVTDSSNFSADTTYNATFEVGETNPYVDEDDDNYQDPQTSESSFNVVERNVEIQGLNDDDTLQLPANSDAELTAESNVAPGTEVNVRMNFPFQYVTTSGEVTEDGMFSTTVDLSSFDAGTQFDTRVRAPGADTQHEVSSVIGEGDGTVPASFNVEASANGPVTVGDSASLEYTITNDGDEAGTTEYTVTVGGTQVANGTTDELAPGNSTTMTYEDFDTSSAGDISWEVSTDGDDSATGTLTVEEESTDDGGDDGTADEGDSDGNDSDGDGGQAGFGLIVALFALIGAALLALRRQN